MKEENAACGGRYDCGYCGSPSCIHHIQDGSGECPFFNRKSGYNEEDIRYRIREIKSIHRGKPMMQEVSPCNESQKFTVEGILKDPVNGDISAIMDTWSLGKIVSCMPFSSMKWSGKLGYGMGTLEPNARLHLHSRGKIIVRKAETLEDAEGIFKWITSFSKPALILADKGLIFWQMLLLSYHSQNEIYPDEISRTEGWYTDDPRSEDAYEISSKAYDDLDDQIGSKIRRRCLDIANRSIEESVEPQEVSILGREITDHWSSLESKGYSDDWHAMGSRVFHLSLTAGIEGLEQHLSLIRCHGSDDLSEGVIDGYLGIWNGGSGEDIFTDLGTDEMEKLRGLMRCVYFLNPRDNEMPRI